MNSRPSEGLVLRFEEDEATSVCEGPSPGILCFGTESGKVVFHNLQTGTREEHKLTGDAINGIAFWDDVIGVSTRSEVSFHCRQQSGDSVKLVARTRVTRGSHGILATPSGCFVCPAGTDGLLCFDPAKKRGRDLWFDRAGDRSLNLYKLIYIGHRDGEEIVGCAARSDGLSTIALQAKPTHNQVMGWSSPDLDIVDVCSLCNPKFPFAFVGLGLDRSLVLVRDPFVDEAPRRLLLQGIEGTPYAIQRARDSFFILTSKELFLFPDASAYLEDERPVSSRPYYSVALHASDIQVIENDWLAVILDERVVFGRIPNAGETGTPQFDSMAWHEGAGTPSFVSTPLEPRVA